MAPTVSSIAAPSGTVIVDQSGSGHFTAINQAVAYAQVSTQPPVLVRAGTYHEVITVSGTAQVNVISESADATSYSKNQVIVSNTSAPLTFSVGGVQGTAWRNINFINTNTGTAPAVSLRSKQNAFYNCQFISSGAGTITASNVGTILIANSYIEGTDKLFSGYLGVYVYSSTIVPTASSSIVVYSKGYSTPTQFSQTVIDSCTISQKTGLSNTYVYLAGANGDGSQAVYKYSSIAGFVAPGGVRTWGTNGFYGEYQTTGLGSFSYDSKRIDAHMNSSMLSNCTIDYVFANSFTGFTSAAMSWVDSLVLRSIAAANVVVSSSGSSSSALTSSSNVSSPSTESQTSIQTATSMSASFSATGGSLTVITTSQTSSSVSPTATCDLPASIPSTALVVGPSGSCAQYNTFSSAIAALPKDSTTQYVYILAGTYT
ncbi:hypothetical protein ONS95_013138 [Cadophora gregata]|uniref:uncharacterized protein n=1 Tax=Cadophora gregata TaxID=51156 RepID=UPI0026DA9606|nr:uncharacterized protein ONS95_013138 [Cadophora gregata]KAK0100047.1 hypothetical protein ONS96_007985 [Cadophora gregata f. sp. sojae]KAK0116106.1 hypothetical protein ONS95_013138 [Cadophora gregata]